MGFDHSHPKVEILRFGIEARRRGDKEERLVAILEETIIMDEKTTVKKGKPLINGFIPKLRGKKVTIRLVSVGQPITGIVDGNNAYEILIQTVKGQVLVFKHAIATIEPVEGQTKGFIITE